ncbi:hypothetical protein H0H81_003735, partial [Sphagnurus paluster]
DSLSQLLMVANPDSPEDIYIIHPAQMQLIVDHKIAIRQRSPAVSHLPAGYHSVVQILNDNPEDFPYRATHYNFKDKKWEIPSRKLWLPYGSIPTTFVDPRFTRFADLGLLRRPDYSFNDQAIEDMMHALRSPHGEAEKKDKFYHKRKLQQLHTSTQQQQSAGQGSMTMLSSYSPFHTHTKTPGPSRSSFSSTHTMDRDREEHPCKKRRSNREFSPMCIDGETNPEARPSERRGRSSSKKELQGSNPATESNEPSGSTTPRAPTAEDKGKGRAKDTEQTEEDELHDYPSGKE